LKKYVLNDLLFDRIGSVDGLAILELGAGNGYFARLLMRRWSGESPERLVITDVSESMLRIAQEAFRVPGAEYRTLDVRRRFPFESAALDLVIATMVLNELPTTGLVNAFRETWRVLRPRGRLLATVVHPGFLAKLHTHGELSQVGADCWTMPGKGALRLSVISRTESAYGRVLAAAGFTVSSTPVFPTQAVLNEHPGLRNSGGLPLALVFECRKADRVMAAGA
jgi:SAM-dependent methyltransferase